MNTPTKIVVGTIVVTVLVVLLLIATTPAMG